MDSAVHDFSRRHGRRKTKLVSDLSHCASSGCGVTVPGVPEARPSVCRFSISDGPESMCQLLLEFREFRRGIKAENCHFLGQFSSFFGALWCGLCLLVFAARPPDLYSEPSEEATLPAA